MGIYKPEDFSSETPPPRIMGTEMEYMASISFARADYVKAIIDSARCLLDANRSTEFLPNGSRLYPDLSHVEYASAESLGPLQAVCAEMAGQVIVAKAAKKVRGDGHPLYRRTGTAHGAEHISLGYHQNLLTTIYEDLETQKQDANLIASYLATRTIWAGGGMVADKYVLSQKAHDITRSKDMVAMVGRLANRTNKRDKPTLLWSAVDHGDVEPHAKDWNRLEIRYADAVHSPWARYMGMATASLMLRLCEHRDMFREEAWPDMTIAHIPRAVLSVSRDTGMRNKYMTESGLHRSALELQRRFAELSLQLAEKVELPTDELWAAHEWMQICDDLEGVDLQRPETLVPISDRVEWAARYLALYRKVGSSLLNKENPEAVGVDLLWDQIHPKSYAEILWRRKQPDFYSRNEKSIKKLIDKPPQYTRARKRSMLMREGMIAYGTRWTAMQQGHTRVYMHDPYDYGL